VVLARNDDDDDDPVDAIVALFVTQADWLGPVVSSRT